VLCCALTCGPTCRIRSSETKLIGNHFGPNRSNRCESLPLGTQTNTATKYLFSARGGPIRAAYKCTQAFVQGMAMKNPKTKRFDWSQVLRDEARITDVLLTEELATKLNLAAG